MALSDALKRLETAQPLRIKVKGVCNFANFYQHLPKEDQKTLDELIQRGVSSLVIRKLLIEEGYKTSLERFNDHRYNRCTCEKKESK